MLHNYFLIAFRNLSKHKLFSAINILGLSVGIACCSILALYIQDELSYDRHFDDAEHIFRVTTAIRQGESPPEILQRTSPPVAMAMLADFPELKSATRIVNPPEVERHLIRYGDNTFFEKTGFLVDSTFLSVFSFELAEGNPATALGGRSSVILSHELAAKLFGNNSGLNESLIITSGFSVDTFHVTGVLKPMLKKSHVNADFYMTMNSEGWGDLINGMTTWSGQNFFFTYIKLRDDASPEQLVAKLAPWLEKNGGDEMRAMKRHKTLGLQPLKDVHLKSGHFEFGFDLAPPGSLWYIYVMGSVAAFILLIACINFMNLTTAKATQRAGEVGVRKTMGASQRELVRQFMGESITIVLIAVVVSAAIVQVALPLFNALASRTISLNADNVAFYVLSLLAIGLVTGILAGSYPSFYLSSFEPALVLKSRNVFSGSSSWLRKGLVIVQFVIAITLIGATIVIHKQLDFVQKQDLGFDAEHRLMIPMRTPEAKQAYAFLKQEVSRVTGVRNISAATSLPSTPLLRDIRVYTEGEDMEQSQHHFICNVDEGYFALLNIPIVAGRELVRETDAGSSDINRIMVNRTSLRKLGIAEADALGKKLMWTGRLNGARDETTLTFEIIGVVDDFNYASLHSGIDPVMFLLPASTDTFVFMGLSIDPGTHVQVNSRLEALWKDHVPGTPFESHFLTEEVQRKYDNDREMSLIISVFTSIAIGISCLGLYGLSIFVGERRLKEIGVRKVLGASTISIVRMLSIEFLILIGIAFLIAIPAGMFAMNKWLENFAYRIDLDIVVFLIAGVVSFAIAWLTISVEAIRAAATNPVNSLKND